MSDTRYSPAIREFIVRQFDSTMASIYSFPLIWMNEYWLANKIDQNKPFQQMLAKQSGLTTVPTLCTNNVDEFRQFVCECKQLVAVKACAGWSASVEEEDIAVGIYTNAIDKQKALSLADSVARAPLLVQPYVPKKHEIRVTVVGTQVFPCRIDSQASPIASEDWRRYDFTNVPHSRCSIPGELRRRILRFMHNAGLHFGALDFIVTPDGEYVFLEVNPSGQYGWIEGLTGMQISRAIADWLLSTESTHN
jgi:glutathione synthase/RimK-type ligase-like ATP-grasp enzyme